jgi:hypothetical protein
MDVSKLPSAGRLYGYAGAIGGFALSFWANVRDAYIPEIPHGVPCDLWRPGYPGYHDVKPNGFDLVLAGFFPVALFVALELLTRVEWKDTGQHKALKWLGVGGLTLVAGIISYSHLRTGFILAGWNTGMASLAPLAVDGFMLLCTTVLLMTGHKAPTILGPQTQVIPRQNPSLQNSVLQGRVADYPAQPMFTAPSVNAAGPAAQPGVHAFTEPPVNAGPAESMNAPVNGEEPVSGTPVNGDVHAGQEPFTGPVNASQKQNKPKPVNASTASPKKAVNKPKPAAVNADREQRRARVHELREQGVSFRDIATELRLSVGFVNKLSKEPLEVVNADDAADAELSNVDWDTGLAEILGERPDNET